MRVRDVLAHLVVHTIMALGSLLVDVSDEVKEGPTEEQVRRPFRPLPISALLEVALLGGGSVAGENRNAVKIGESQRCHV